jgi:hypothetical protein
MSGTHRLTSQAASATYSVNVELRDNGSLLDQGCPLFLQTLFVSAMDSRLAGSRHAVMCEVLPLV